MPKVSVIIPYFNKSNTIHRAVSSVLNQTHQNWEIIIVDDASDLPLLMEDAWASYPLRILRNPMNLGPGPSRQLGMDYGNGEFFAFLDADDWWSPQFIEKCLNKLSNDADAAAAWVQSEIHGRDGSVSLRRYSSIPFVLIRETILQYARPWQTGSLLWRKECCGEWGSLSSNQDYFFEFTSSFKSNKVVPVGEVLYHVDQGQGNHRTNILTHPETVSNQFKLHWLVFNGLKGQLNLKSRILLFHRIVRALWKVNESCDKAIITEAWMRSEQIYPFLKLFFREPYMLRVLHAIFQRTAYKLYF